MGIAVHSIILPFMGSEGRYYNAKFYREMEQARDSAREILPLIIELIKPASIVDIGCGAGHWLAAAVEMGISDVLGVDGEWASEANLTIPREMFVVRDLRKEFDVGRRFDLALSLEVGEHLPRESAAGLVQGLCKTADKVLFSAAIPGQGGRNHVNEQWPAYWAELFKGCGYRCYDVVRPRVWNNPRVLWYYAQNCLVFVRGDSAPAFSRLGVACTPLSLVHPTAWSAEITRRNSPGKLLERLPRAIVSGFGRNRT